MNTEKVLFIVGNKFNEFALNKNVLTIDQLKAMLCLPKSVIGCKYKVILGQGVQENEIMEVLHDFENKCSAKDVFEIEDLKRVTDRVGSSYSHKRIFHNTIIGTPKQKTSSVFEIPLNIDERCELMGDHQTGQHIQGMLMVEAFRQTFIAVTDMFYPFCESGKNYHVINTMNTDFKNFLFPLPAHIEYTILEQDVTSRRARYRTTLSAIQNGVSCASAEISFSVYSAKIISEKEAEMAVVAVQKYPQIKSANEQSLINLAIAA